MKAWQKAIKYGALAFAVFLCISIFLGILSALSFLPGLENQSEPVGDPRSFAVSQTVDSLDIELSACSLQIRTGEELAVESNVTGLSVKETGNTLTIRDQRGFWNQKTAQAVVIVSLPETMMLERVRLSTGAGKVTIESLCAATLDFEFGAGTVDIDHLVAKERAEFDGGAGRVTIQSGSLKNLDLDMGVGALSIGSRLIGKSQLELGVGQVQLTLLGSRQEYNLRVDKGLGDIRVDGQTVSDGTVIGTGDSRVSLEGGVGAVRVNFESESDF